MSWNIAAAGTIAAEAPASARVAFIRKTYLHLGGAVLAFIAVEAALITSPLAQPIVQTLLGGRMSWLIVPAAFMAVGWVADRWARSATSPAMQYQGLGLYVVAEAVIMPAPVRGRALRKVPEHHPHSRNPYRPRLHGADGNGVSHATRLLVDAAGSDDRRHRRPG